MSNKPTISIFRLQPDSRYLRKWPDLADSDCTALLISGGMNDFDHRRSEWKWNRTIGSCDEVLAQIEQAKFETLMGITKPHEASPFLRDAEAWIVPTILWSLMDQTGRLYLMFDQDCNDQAKLYIRKTHKADTCEHTIASTEQHWQQLFFDMCSGGIGLGFASTETELEKHIQSAPEVVTTKPKQDRSMLYHNAPEFRESVHPMLWSGLKEHGMSWLLDIASVVLLPYCNENRDGLLLTRRMSQVATLEAIRSGIGDRAEVIELSGDDSYRNWLHCGALE